MIFPIEKVVLNLYKPLWSDKNKNGYGHKHLIVAIFIPFAFIHMVTWGSEPLKRM